MNRSTAVSETRSCNICHAPFNFVRQVGRPPELCGATCRKAATVARNRRWRARLLAARDELATLRAAQAA